MKIIKSLLILFSLYGFVVLFLHFFIDVFVFRPERLQETYNFRFDEEFEEIDLERENGQPINALLFYAPDTIKGIVLYFHGNADNLQRWGHYTVDFTQHGYDVLCIDYPGYGKSEGKPSETALYQSVETTYQWAANRYPKEQIIIYGRSLGCAPAAYLSQKYPSKTLILETPFYALEDVMRQRYAWLMPFRPKYSFPVNEYLARSQAPAFIFQGTKDRIVPYSSAVKLKPLLKAEKDFFVIEGGGHKNLREFPEYHQALGKILN